MQDKIQKTLDFLRKMRYNKKNLYARLHPCGGQGITGADIPSALVQVVQKINRLLCIYIKSVVLAEFLLILREMDGIIVLSI